MAGFRAVSGIDFDGVGGEPGLRVEPGETLPPLADATAGWLLDCGAIEPIADDEPAAKPRRTRRKAAD